MSYTGKQIIDCYDKKSGIEIMAIAMAVIFTIALLWMFISPSIIIPPDNIMTLIGSYLFMMLIPAFFFTTSYLGRKRKLNQKRFVIEHGEEKIGEICDIEYATEGTLILMADIAA